MRLIAAAAALATVALVVACESEAKTSARSLVDAVARFRTADDGEKIARAPFVAAVACIGDEVCEAQRVCVAFVEPTAAALRTKAEAERAVAERRAGGALDPGAAVELLGRIDEAEAQLRQGRERLPRCDDALLALKRRYGI